MEPPNHNPGAGDASLEVTDPGGRPSRVALDPLPFRIGRAPENELVLRDSRVSRWHAIISQKGSVYVIEDRRSTRGTFVNGRRIERLALQDGDRIGFGADDSYSLTFILNAARLRRLLDGAALAPGASDRAREAPGGLARLKAILEMARVIESSLSIDDILASLVDAAMAVTGAERGFLLLRTAGELEIRVARGRGGRRLEPSELRVPRKVLNSALENRRDLLTVSFDTLGGNAPLTGQTVMDLRLRSAVCVPLVRIRAGQADATSVLDAGAETAGALYMDSRSITADLAGGGRELLQTLAIEASTVLENARLLEEERAKLRMEEELDFARNIQRSLLPRDLPRTGWLRAAASAVPSHAVGGDYYDLVEINPGSWAAVIADVSGKGVGAALLASLLQGAFVAVVDTDASPAGRVARMNRFLLDRTAGEKYATAFSCMIHSDGTMRYVNAAQCPPLLLHADGSCSALEASGPPIGLIEDAEFAVAEARLTAGDKIVCYTDGVTEARCEDGEFFGRKRLKQIAVAHASESCESIRKAIQEALETFTTGAPQADDITLLILEYAPE